MALSHKINGKNLWRLAVAAVILILVAIWAASASLQPASASDPAHHAAKR